MPAWHLIFTRRRANGTQTSVLHRCVPCYGHTANHQDTVKVDRERSTINLPGKKKRNIREVLCSRSGFDPGTKRFISKCSCLGVAEIKVLSIPNGKE